MKVPDFLIYIMILAFALGIIYLGLSTLTTVIWIVY